MPLVVMRPLPVIWGVWLVMTMTVTRVVTVPPLMGTPGAAAMFALKSRRPLLASERSWATPIRPRYSEADGLFSW